MLVLVSKLYLPPEILLSKVENTFTFFDLLCLSSRLDFSDRYFLNGSTSVIDCSLFLRGGDFSPNIDSKVLPIYRFYLCIVAYFDKGNLKFHFPLPNFFFFNYGGYERVDRQT